MERKDFIECIQNAKDGTFGIPFDQNNVKQVVLSFFPGGIVRDISNGFTVETKEFKAFAETQTMYTMVWVIDIKEVE